MGAYGAGVGDRRASSGRFVIAELDPSSVQDRVEYTQFRFYSAFLREGSLELRADEAALPGAQID